MYNKSEFTPVPFEQANNVSPGRELTTEEKVLTGRDKTGQTQVYSRTGHTVVKMKLFSFFLRLKFLFTGEIYVMVLEDKLPPISVSIDSPLTAE